jgi:hypothetical protein
MVEDYVNGGRKTPATNRIALQPPMQGNLYIVIQNY